MLSGMLADMKLGYARVSTADQNLDLQLDALTKAGCYEIYTDHGVTGRTMNRPELESCIRALRPGDTLCVWKLDRLGRNVRGLSTLLEELEEKSVYFESLTEGIDTSTPVGRLLFHVLASVAEMESNLISERTKAGIAAMRVRSGVKGGRPAALTSAQRRQLVRMRSEVNPETGKIWTIRQLADFYGVGASTVVRTLDKSCNHV